MADSSRERNVLCQQRTIGGLVEQWKRKQVNSLSIVLLSKQTWRVTMECLMSTKIVTSLC